MSDPRVNFTWLLAALLLVSGATAQVTVDYTDDVYPGNERAGWVASRVVDDLTGDPIRGADVYFVREAETPLAGAF